MAMKKLEDVKPLTKLLHKFLLLVVAGAPYDTLEEVIVLRDGNGLGSLKDFGIKCREVLADDKGLDWDALEVVNVLLGGKEFEFLIAILPDNNGSLYGPCQYARPFTGQKLCLQVFMAFHFVSSFINHGKPYVAAIVDAATIRPQVIFTISSTGDLCEFDPSSKTFLEETHLEQRINTRHHQQATHHILGGNLARKWKSVVQG